MSNYNSIVNFTKGQSIFFKTEKPSVMRQLAMTLTKQGVNAQVVKKLNYVKEGIHNVLLSYGY